MATLYDIAADLQTALDAFGEADGDASAELFASLDAMEGAFAAKAERVIRAIRNYEAHAAACTAEADRLYRSAASAKRQSESLKAYLKGRMESLSLTHLNAGVFKVRIQANGQPSVKCDIPPETLPDEMQRVKVEANLTYMLEWWKLGKELPPGVRVERGTHLRIS